MCVCVYGCPQGLNPALVARLQEWRFMVRQLGLVARRNVVEAIQPTALRNALTQLHTHLNTPTPIIQLSAGWQVTHELIDTIATALPAHVTLKIAMNLGEHALDLVARHFSLMGPRMRSVFSESVMHTVAANMPWAWECMCVRGVNSAALPGLLSAPLPAGVARRTIHADILGIGKDVTQVRTEDACLHL